MEHLIEYEIDIPDLKCSEFPMPESAYRLFYIQINSFMLNTNLKTKTSNIWNTSTKKNPQKNI